jgi:archaemetzincin
VRARSAAPLGFVVAIAACAADERALATGGAATQAVGVAPSPATPAAARIAVVPPDPIAALGLRGEPLPDDEIGYFAADGFLPPAPPTPSDWLALHVEPSQSYPDFLRGRRPPVGRTRRAIYLQPLGEPPVMVDVEALAAYVGAYFGLDVVVEDPAPLVLDGAEVAPGQRAPAEAILLRLADQVPADAALVLALTTADLFPIGGGEVVYGLGSPGRRVAVVSTARLAPSAPPAERRLTLHRRLFAIATHELGHALGVAHCAYYGCVMNGAAHLAEIDAHPLAVCPVDLRKLHRAIGLDLGGRERALLRILRRVGLEADAAWLAARRAR